MRNRLDRPEHPLNDSGWNMWVREYCATAIPEYGGFPSVHGRCSEPPDEDVPKCFGSFLTVWPDVAGYCARVSFSFRPLMCIQKKKKPWWCMAPGPSPTRPSPFLRTGRGAYLRDRPHLDGRPLCVGAAHRGGGAGGRPAASVLPASLSSARCPWMAALYPDEGSACAR